MTIDFLTREDLEEFRSKLLIDIEGIIYNNKTKKWLKTQDVLAILEISEVTLQSLRNNGIIPFRKIGGICYYHADELDQALLSLPKGKKHLAEILR
ncbi:helix-turn-helix domain-containing protein [Chitinophaga varians]|uniref:Helix-turn-helix domain-containing protein n=1 Tax=Chitinophaga varians TaxID=2202339 RepID=A0A847S2B5_9BACT|nr:helix-turn-helix domain-containing protein [Chitinophaga varians]NLR68534.1 helix-turn-helix domain-containing protein [Chitinophaga varians]